LGKQSLPLFAVKHLPNVPKSSIKLAVSRPLNDACRATGHTPRKSKRARSPAGFLEGSATIVS
jgi:hypothetical protein